MTAFALIILSSSFALAQGTTAKPAKKTRHSYQLTIDTKLNINASGQKITLDSPTIARYYNEGSQSAYIVQLTDLIVTVKINGAENSHMEMSKKLFKIRQKGQEQSIPFDKANPQLQGILKANFHKVMATITADKEGKELTRKVQKADKTKTQFSGMVHNVRWFHVRFPADKTWTETRQFDLGKGGVITGPMTFTKQDKKDASGNTIVKMTGKMSKESIKTDNGNLTNVNYVFEGTQSYDEKRRIWVSGETKVTATYKMATPQGKADTSGTITLKLSMPKTK